MEYTASKSLLKSALAAREPHFREFSSANPPTISLASRLYAEISEKSSRSTLPFTNSVPPENVKHSVPEVYSSIDAECEGKQQLFQTEKTKQLLQNKIVELQLQVEAQNEEIVTLRNQLCSQADILCSMEKKNLEESNPRHTLLRRSSIEELSFPRTSSSTVLSASNSCHSSPSREVHASLTHHHPLISELSEKQDEVSALDVELETLHQRLINGLTLEKELEIVPKVKALLKEKDKIRKRLEGVVELEEGITDLRFNKIDEKYDKQLFSYAELVEKYADSQKKNTTLVETNQSLIDENSRITEQAKKKEASLLGDLDDYEQGREKIKTQLLASEIRAQELQADLANITVERKHVIEELQESQTANQSAREELERKLESALMETTSVRKEVEIKAVQLQESEVARQELEKENVFKESAVKLEKERVEKLREKMLEVESLCVTASSEGAAPLWEAILLSNCTWDITATRELSPIRELIAHVSRQLAAIQSVEWCAAVFHSFQSDEGYFVGDIGNVKMRPPSNGFFDDSVGSNETTTVEPSETACRDKEDLKGGTDLRVECEKKENFSSFQERVWDRMHSIPLQEVWEIAAAFLNKEDIRPSAIWNSLCEHTVKKKSTSRLQRLVQQESTARRAIERKLVEETIELASQDRGVSVDLMRNQVYDLLEQLVFSSTECRDSLEKLEEFMVLVDDARSGEKQARESLQRRDEEFTEHQKRVDQEKQQMGSLVQKATKILREQYSSCVSALEERNTVLFSQQEEIQDLRISKEQCKNDNRKLIEAIHTKNEELEDTRKECSEMLLKMEECMRLTEEARESERNMLKAMNEEQKKNVEIMAKVDKDRQHNQLFEAKVCDEKKRMEDCFHVLDEFVSSGTLFLEMNVPRRLHSLSARRTDTESLSDCPTENGPRLSLEVRDSTETRSNHHTSLSPPRECSPCVNSLPAFSGSSTGNEELIKVDGSVSQERYDLDPDRLHAFLVHFLDRQNLQEKEHELKEEKLMAKYERYFHQWSQLQVKFAHLQELLEERSMRMEALLKIQESMNADIELLRRLDQESEPREESLE